MTTTVTSEDVSALLDGALSPERAAEVRAAIATDPLLRAEFRMLERLDSCLAQLAEEAAFMPQISLPAAQTVPWATAMAILAALLLVRFAPKLLDLALLGVALQVAAAAGILIAIVAITRDKPSTTLEGSLA